MKKILVLFTRTSVASKSADPEAFVALLSTDKISVDWAYYEDLLFGLLGNGQVALHNVRHDTDICDYSAVYFRTWANQESHANAAARICKILNVPFIDKETGEFGSKSKLSQYVKLYENNIAVPRSLMGNGSAIVGNYRRYDFMLPCVMKDKSGTRGRDNYLISTHEELIEIATAHPDKTFILQEFLPNKGDYRVLVFAGKAKMVIYRTAKAGTHLNNISQGGSAEIVEPSQLPSEAIAMSEKAAIVLGRDVAGVDIVRSEKDGKYYCFEVNRAPQIEHSSFEKQKAKILQNYLLSISST